MNDLIQRIVAAIIRQEGAKPDSTNPGNLRGAPWLSGPKAFQNGFWLPVTRAQGVAGLAHVVALHIAEGDSLTTFIGKYAPSADHNNTVAYIANVSKWAGIPDTISPLQEFLGV